MAGRIVLFGATGYTGRLAAEAMVERGLRPVLAARSADRLQRAGGRAGRRPRDGHGRRVGSAERARARGAGRRAGEHRRAVRALGRPGRGGGVRPRARTTSTPPASRRSSERSSSATARPPSSTARACSPPSATTGFPETWPARSRSTAAGGRGYARGHRLLLHRPGAGLDERRHPGVARRRGHRPVVRLPRRAHADGARRAARALVPRSARRSARRCASAAPSTSRCRGFAPQLREVNSYLGWFGPASRAMQALLGGRGGRHEGARDGRLWDAATARFVKGSTGGPDAAARAQVAARTSWRSPTTRRVASCPRCT